MLQLLNYASTTLLFSDRSAHWLCSCSPLSHHGHRAVDANIISWNKVILLHGLVWFELETERLICSRFKAAGYGKDVAVPGAGPKAQHSNERQVCEVKHLQ